METIIFLAVAVVLIALLGFAIYRLRTRVSREKESVQSFTDVIAGTVVADLIGYLVLRDSEGKIYALPREYVPDAGVDDILYAECFDNAKQDDQLLNAVKFDEYTISQEKNAKRAQFVRRLNEQYALCLLGKETMLVRCGVYEQMMAQRAVSLVTGTRFDGNDRLELKCRNAIELPICKTDGEVVLPICHPA